MLLKKNKPKSLVHINKLCIFAADMADNIYMPIVDTWILVNNSETPRSIVASGGNNQETVIRNSVLFKDIEGYVKRRA